MNKKLIDYVSDDLPPGAQTISISDGLVMQIFTDGSVLLTNFVKESLFINQDEMNIIVAEYTKNGKKV